jgi:hypothetical protein
VTARQRPRTKATYSPNTRTSTYFHVLWTVRCPEINVLMNPAAQCSPSSCMHACSGINRPCHAQHLPTITQEATSPAPLLPTILSYSNHNCHFSTAAPTTAALTTQPVMHHECTATYAHSTMRCVTSTRPPVRVRHNPDTCRSRASTIPGLLNPKPYAQHTVYGVDVGSLVGSHACG